MTDFATPEQVVNRALEGDTDAARYILRECAEFLQIETLIPAPYARYLAASFLELLEGKDADVALGTRAKKPGRPPGAVTHEKVELVACNG
jgi:hypothetical protein